MTNPQPLTVCILQPRSCQAGDSPIATTEQVIQLMESAVEHYHHPTRKTLEDPAEAALQPVPVEAPGLRRYSKSIDLILLPELCPIGRSTPENKALHREIERRLRTAAKRLGCAICYGAKGGKEPDGNTVKVSEDYVIRRVVIDSVGEILCSMEGDSPNHFCLPKIGPGGENWKLGFLAPSELGDPALLDGTLHNSSIHAIIQPTSLPGRDDTHLKASRRSKDTHTTNTGLYFLASNYAGEGLGGSFLSPPLRRGCYETTELGDRESYLLATLDPKAVKHAGQRRQKWLAVLALISLLAALIGVSVSVGRDKSSRPAFSSNVSNPDEVLQLDEESEKTFEPEPTASPSRNAVDSSPTPSFTFLSSRQPAPTNTPTSIPTRSPTLRPTSRPTGSPSIATPEPTSTPITNPTRKPTFRPTTNPTRKPTFRPTNRPPTNTPTSIPTRSPTLRPTSRPTGSPSIATPEPTSNPTTSSPTVAPTLRQLLPEEIRERLVEFLIPFSGESALNDEASSRYRATDLLLEVLALDSDAVRSLATVSRIGRSSSSSTVVESEQAQRVLNTYVVILLYVSTEGDGWTNPINFFTSDNICEWNGSAGGVFCDSSNRAVKSMLLYENNLQGTLIPELGFLDTLEWLLVTDNPGISGRIPSELGNLKGLLQLTLVDNSITGSIPSRIFSDLQGLEQLRLSGNLLTGSIPAEFAVSEGDDPSLTLSALKEIYLDGNIGLRGDLAELLNVVPKSLEAFVCGGCDFTRSSTRSSAVLESVDWARLGSLKTLSLGETGLSGSIPRTLGTVESLVVLELDRNNLVGPIPNNLATDLLLLEELVLHTNSLTGNLPAISSPVLRILDVEENALQGNLGSIFVDSEFTMTIQNLLLGYNDFTGSLASEIGSFQALEYLGIAYNSITGEIPTQLEDLTSLSTLELQGNKFEGTIPDALARLPNLFYIGLHDNPGLSGADLNEVFCSGSRGIVALQKELTVDCAEPQLVSCRCCQCYSIDAGKFV